jgi:hypothetical protein
MLLRTSEGVILPGRKSEKPPEEWTVEETAEQERRLIKACRLCAELRNAKENGCGRHAAATRFKQAMAVLYSSSHAASLILVAALPWAGYG